jgi:photosystem II stability/assembly factor-like uncharacterized protein
MKPVSTLLISSAAISFLALTSLTLFGCSTPAEPNVLEGDREREEEREEGHPHGAQVRAAMRVSEDGTVPPNAIWNMKLQRDRMLANQPEYSGPLLNNWKWLGPGNIGGRVRAILIHPTTPATMWAGSVGGGIFKTTNGGASWTPLDGFAPMMSVGCMVLDPKDPKRIFAGTGEGFFDTLAGSSILAASRGAGIFLSTDSGTTWSQLPSTNNANFHFVNRLSISPADNKIMLAATMSGIWRTTNAGTTWTKVNSSFAMDVDFHPTDGKLAVAGVRDGTPYYSTNGGVNWTAASGTGFKQRSEMAYAKSNPGIVYACCSLNNRMKVYQSTNGGKSFTLKTGGSGLSTYSRYNNALWVDPTNVNHVLVGGVRLHKSTNAGASFVNAYSGSYYDYHVFANHPGYNGTTNQTVFHGNDGGVYRTTAVKASTIRWTELNNNLGLTQFYGAAMSPSGRVIGGTQDNGSLLFRGNPEGWSHPLGGDGCYCAADPTNSNILYAQIYWIRIYRSLNGGSNWSQIGNSSKIRDKGSNFIPYITLDPNNANRMYFLGASVWRSDNVKGSATWQEVKPALSCTDANAHFGLDPKCNASIVQVAKGNSNIVWVGHNHGNLYMSQNALSTSRTWKRVDTNVHPNRWVGCIAIDPRDNRKVYVSFLGYHKNNVWVTTDSGTTWKAINGSGTKALPETPVNWITVHPKVPGCLFAGTDIGLFYSTDDGTTWQTTKEGGSTSPIAELQWKNDRTMMVVTHGRGIFTVDVGEAPFAKLIGAGCGKSGKPAMAATVPIPGQTQKYMIAGATASSPVLLMVDPGTTTVSIGNGCTLYIKGTWIVPIGSTNNSGILNYDLKVPLSKDIVGAMATVQAAILTAGGPALGIAELTNGLEMRAGF